MMMDKTYSQEAYEILDSLNKRQVTLKEACKKVDSIIKKIVLMAYSGDDDE